MITWGTLPEALQELKSARTNIREAKVINGAQVRHDAEAHVRNALEHVFSTPEVIGAADDAIGAGVMLGTYLEEQGPFAVANTVEDLRSEAFAALNRLMDVLKDCKPSAKAQHLGLGW